MIQKNKNEELDLDAYKNAAEFTRIMNQAVQDAQEASRRAGVPLVYSINGILHWELPDGSLTTEDPWAGKNFPPGSNLSQ